jgi:glucose-6-phosphate 1-dehydrogenase
MGAAGGVPPAGASPSGCSEVTTRAVNGVAGIRDGQARTTGDVAAAPTPATIHFRPLEPVLLVIFGATGDLSRRKLLPSLYNLARDDMLPEGFAVLGAAKEELSTSAFRALAEDSIRHWSRSQPIDARVLNRLLELVFYQQLDLRDEAGYARLGRRLEQLDEERQTRHWLYYCATPPGIFATIVRNLDAAGLARGSDDRQRRILIEKPFGTNLQSARDLNQLVARSFGEERVYRIDHYLAKETVQNILVLRFANSVFEPIWSNHYVDNVQITVAEQLGIEGRAAYYERAGALRDMVQNHLLQLLTLVTLEPPVSYDHQALRDEKVKVLRAVTPIKADSVDEHVVRGQYGPGRICGQPVPGYREEPGVAPHSTTESYVALRVSIDSWRWAGVPFYLRTGKRLAKRASEVRIEFKPPPHITFGRQATRDLEPNSITVRIQPDEGVALRVGAKAPEPGMEIRSVDMDFGYGRSFGRGGADAYEHLLVDGMVGDPTHFIRADEVEAAWMIIDPIEERWATGLSPLYSYPAGSWGPQAADELLARDGRKWHLP